MGKVTCVLLGVVLLASALRVNGRMCYGCKFVGCSDEFNRHDLGVVTDTCDGSCVKSKWGQQITRRCSDTFTEDGCRDEKINGNTGRVCYCNSDFCNKGSDVIGTTMTSLVFMPTFLTVFLRL